MLANHKSGHFTQVQIFTWEIKSVLFFPQMKQFTYSFLNQPSVGHSFLYSEHNQGHKILGAWQTVAIGFAVSVREPSSHPIFLLTPASANT